MKISKHNGKVKFTEYTPKELTGLLKLQASVEIILLNGEVLNVGRKNEQGDIIDTNDKVIMTFSDLIIKLNSGIEHVLITVTDFRLSEQLIMNLDKCDSKKITSCSFIDYYNNIFMIAFKPEPNGASNKMYYFEDDNTFLFFDKNGPNLKTETKSSSFLDLIG